MKTKFYYCAMKLKMYRSVKIPKDIVKQVEEHKKKTGIPISVFFVQAVTEKLNKIKAKYE